MPVFNKMVYNGTEYILGGGGNIGEPLNLTVTTSGLDATITWEDNEIGTIPPTTFQKSELVRKIGSAPTSPSDGDLVVTETVKDTYKVSGYVDSGLTDGETYYYRVFSYSDLGGISYCDAVNVTVSSHWQPGANTLGYRPFKSDLNEASGKTGLDWNIERGSVSYSNNMATINTLRISSMIFTGTGDYTILMYRTSNDTNFGFRLRCDSSWFPLQQLDIRGQAIFNSGTYTWYECFNSNPDTSVLLAVAVRENNDLYYYENGVLVKTTTAPSINISGGPGISMGAFGTDNTSGSVGNLIVEDRAWTLQEISDYFDQTKGDYGIS